MAKTTGPLMSISASGTFGDVITFDRSGRAHKPNAPTSQYTAARGNARQIFLAISRALSCCSDATITAMILSGLTSNYWRAAMTDAMSGKGHTTWNARRDTWLALDASARDDWDDTAQTYGFRDAMLAYATDPIITGGLSMWQLASALYSAGIITSPGEPDVINAAAWAIAITGEAPPLPPGAIVLNGEVLTLAGEILVL